MKRSTLGTIGATLLVLVTLPFYFAIAGLSLMAFDAPSAPELLWRARIFVLIVIALCTVVPCGSLYLSIKFFRKDRMVPGVVWAVVPVLALGVFWLWLMQQSFS